MIKTHAVKTHRNCSVWHSKAAVWMQSITHTHTVDCSLQTAQRNSTLWKQKRI